MLPVVLLGLRDGGRRNAAARSRAACGGYPSFGLAWTILQEEQRLQADHSARVQESINIQLGGPEKLTGADEPQHAL